MSVNFDAGPEMQGGKTLRFMHLAVCFGVAVILPFMIYFGVRAATGMPDLRLELGFAGPTQPQIPFRATPEEEAAIKAKFDAEIAAEKALTRSFGLRMLFVSLSLVTVAVLLGARQLRRGYGIGLVAGGVFSILLSLLMHADAADAWLRLFGLLFVMVVLSFAGWRVQRSAMKS